MSKKKKEVLQEGVPEGQVHIDAVEADRLASIKAIVKDEE